MREMKDSGVEWIGEIPAGWSIVKVKYTGQFENGLTYSPNDVSDERGILVLRSSNIQSGKLDFNDCVYVLDVPESLMVKCGDIVICSRNGSVDLVGKSVYIDHNIVATFGAFMMRYRTKIFGKFAFYMLQPVITHYKSFFTTSTINQLTIKTIRQMLVPIPPIAEQNAIASYLDDKCSNIDTIITKNEQIIEKLKEYKSSLITETVTKGLNPDVEMKNSGVEWIGEIPAEWKAIKLKYVIKIENGINPQTEGNIPVYGSGSESFKTCGEYKEGPAVLLGRKGTINIPRYIEGKYWNVDTVFSVTTISFMLKLKFFYYVSTCFDYSFYNLQTTLPSMTQTNYNNMFIPLPPLTEQIAIAAYLDEKCSKIDANIKNRELIIQKLAEYKKSIIYEVVTGKKEAVYRQCFIRKIEGEIKNGNIFKSE